MFKNQRENVDKLTSLRLRYLLLILKEGVASIAGITVQERNLVTALTALEQNDPTFICLCTCDLLMSATDWALTWGKLLSTQTDMASLCEKMLQSFGLEKEGLLTKNAKKASESDNTEGKCDRNEAAESQNANKEGGDAKNTKTDHVPAGGADGKTGDSTANCF